MRAKKCIFLLSIPLVVFIGVIYYIQRKDLPPSNYGYYYHCEPDDDFSKSVMNDISGEYLYQGCATDSDNVIVYYFFILKRDITSIEKISETVNKYSDLLDSRVQINLMDGSPSMSRGVLALYNFSSENRETYDDGKFHNLDIIWITDFVFWNDPSTYTCFNGIKRLGLPNTLQDRADENGVDWYDAWPELEEMEIYETNEKGDIVK